MRQRISAEALDGEMLKFGQAMMDSAATIRRLTAELAASRAHVRQLRDALEAILAERSHGITANWDFIERVAAEAFSSTETEGK